MKKTVIILFSLGILFLMLWFPHIEGRNINATNFEIYFKDPFLAYAYIASIAFFVSMYQIYKLVDEGLSSKRLRIIKICALTLIGFLIGALAYFAIFVRGNDDITGGISMGFLLICVSSVVAIVAGKLQKRVESK